MHFFQSGPARLAYIDESPDTADRREPILLVHGRDDTVVPLEQSNIMQRALEKAGNAPEMVVLNGEDHWLSRGETRLRMLNALTMFLEKNNPPS